MRFDDDSRAIDGEAVSATVPRGEVAGMAARGLSWRHGVGSPPRVGETRGNRPSLNVFENPYRRNKGLKK